MDNSQPSVVKADKPVRLVSEGFSVINKSPVMDSSCSMLASDSSSLEMYIVPSNLLHSASSIRSQLSETSASTRNVYQDMFKMVDD